MNQSSYRETHCPSAGTLGVESDDRVLHPSLESEGCTDGAQSMGLLNEEHEDSIGAKKGQGATIPLRLLLGKGEKRLP